MEALALYGDGNYWYIDTVYEARKALVTEAGGTFVTVAEDVKLQLDFNPAKVAAYRLVGYEDRVLAAADFADDSVDGGMIGSGHQVTVLYELIPAGSGAAPQDEARSRYVETVPGNSAEWLTVSIRAKTPGSESSDLWQYPLLPEEISGEPEGNIRTGVKYLSFLQGVFAKRLPEGATSDLTKFMLAAYNGGEGRLLDCIDFAKELNVYDSTWACLQNLPDIARMSHVQADSLDMRKYNLSQIAGYVGDVLDTYAAFLTICP